MATGQFTAGDLRIDRSGRPKVGKSMAEWIRGRTREGTLLAQYYWSVWNDESEPTEMRMRAAEKLEFRAFGKPAQIVDAHIEQAGVTLHINVDPLARPDE